MRAAVSCHIKKCEKPRTFNEHELRIVLPHRCRQSNAARSQKTKRGAAPRNQSSPAGHSHATGGQGSAASRGKARIDKRCSVEADKRASENADSDIRSECRSHPSCAYERRRSNGTAHQELW